MSIRWNSIIALAAFAAALTIGGARVWGASGSADATGGSADWTHVAGLAWHTDYFSAYRQAREEKRMMLVNFVGGASQAQQGLESTISSDPSLQEKLSRFVLVRLPSSVQVPLDGDPVRLLSHDSFREMHGAAGVAIVDLQNKGARYYGSVVSAYPFTSGKYYRWRPDYLREIVDLPPGTITQRTMVWAVRTHPENPASTEGQQARPLATAAASHSAHQASIGVQGHHNWDSRFHQVRAAAEAHEASEVVAESWPNQTMIDSCIDCVRSWRQSSGHWGAVRRRHRLFGYDIKRGRNGIWYGTGIFAN